MTKYIFTRDLPPTFHKKGDIVDDNEPFMYVQSLATWLALGYIEEVKEEKYCDKNILYRTEAEALEAKKRVEQAYKGI